MTQEQAKVALKQLTGRENPYNTLSAMIGAKNFGITGNAIVFLFKMWSKANICRLELDEGLDLYNLIFLKLNKKTFSLDEKARFDGIYGDQLKEIFQETTGLRLSL